MRTIIIEDGDGKTGVVVAQHDLAEVRLSPANAVELGYLIVRKAREVCQHRRQDRMYDSDGSHDLCLDCGVEIV